MIIQMKKGSNHQRKEEGRDREFCVEKRRTQKVFKEHRMKQSAKSTVRSANGD